MKTTEPRVAIVSGGAQGIGAAIATKLAHTGHTVAIVDMDPRAEHVAEELRRSGSRVSAFVADVSDESQVVGAFDRISAELGPASVLVNNAGVTRDNLLHKMSVTDWDTVMEVHLKGAFLMAREAQRVMVSAGWGRIVNLSSISAQGNPGQANYSAAKAGLVGFTRTLAMELGRFGITVNAVAPGYIDTAMLRATASRREMTFQDFSAEAARQIPLRRIGSQQDVAELVSFLSSDVAGYISGETIHVAGGLR